MKRILFSMAAFGALASMPGPAAATPSTGAAYDGGRCLVTADRRSAVALMTALPLGDVPADLSRLRGAGAACVARLAGAPSMLVRGAIAQALFLRDFRGLGREPRDNRQIVDLDLPVEASFGAPRDSTTHLYRWSDCVVRNDPTGANRLLHSGVGSAGEATAIAGLQTYMSRCMAAGGQLSLRPWEVRSLFAQSAYHALYRYWTGQLDGASGR